MGRSYLSTQALASGKDHQAAMEWLTKPGQLELGMWQKATTLMLQQPDLQKSWL